MKLGDLYRRAVAAGIEADPRGAERVAAELARTRKNFERLTEKEKAYFEAEKLQNPYADTRILWGDPGVEVGGLLVGVDMEVGEMLLADRLRSQGKRVDAVLAHHPEGRALAQFYQVMSMQADILQGMGVPINVAEGLLAERIKEVAHRILPVNHTRAADAARELGIPLLCIHTPADNSVTSFLQKSFDKSSPYRVEDVTDMLLEIPEYARAAAETTGPDVVVGQKENRAGRVFVDMTGGTEGSKEIFSKLAVTQVGTIVCMHLSEEHLKEAEKNHINVVIAGHIASDTIGLNLVLDRVIEGDMAITCCSGFTRVDRRAAGR